MFGNAVMANSVSFQQWPVDISVLRMNVENAFSEFVDVRNGIDKLANQMCGASHFEADIVTFGNR